MAEEMVRSEEKLPHWRHWSATWASLVMMVRQSTLEDWRRISETSQRDLRLKRSIKWLMWVALDLSSMNTKNSMGGMAAKTLNSATHRHWAICSTGMHASQSGDRVWYWGKAGAWRRSLVSRAQVSISAVIEGSRLMVTGPKCSMKRMMDSSSSTDTRPMSSMRCKMPRMRTRLCSTSCTNSVGEAPSLVGRAFLNCDWIRFHSDREDTKVGWVLRMS